MALSKKSDERIVKNTNDSQYYDIIIAIHFTTTYRFSRKIEIHFLFDIVFI